MDIFKAIEIIATLSLDIETEEQTNDETLIDQNSPVVAINKIADNYMVKLGKAKEKKHDSKAKVRNRGNVCCPASSPNVSDDKDHFPINSIEQARNALARVHQYKGKKPSWWKGSLESLQNTVSRKVHSKYPSIGKSKD